MRISLRFSTQCHPFTLCLGSSRCNGGYINKSCVTWILLILYLHRISYIIGTCCLVLPGRWENDSLSSPTNFLWSDHRDVKGRSQTYITDNLQLLSITTLNQRDRRYDWYQWQIIVNQSQFVITRGPDWYASLKTHPIIHTYPHAHARTSTHDTHAHIQTRACILRCSFL